MSGDEPKKKQKDKVYNIIFFKDCSRQNPSNVDHWELLHYKFNTMSPNKKK